MSKNPLNLALRFLLELAAISAFGAWGYSLSSSGLKYILAILMALLFALLWGVFAVRNDPSRSGKTVVSTPGPLRLILELLLFGAASWMLFRLDQVLMAIILAALVLLHYLLSWDRIAWLLKQK
jgi:hypothetical protein